jgi:hypothetical protein
MNTVAAQYGGSNDRGDPLRRTRARDCNRIVHCGALSDAPVLTLHTEQLPYSRDQPLEGRLVARSSSTGALFALIGSRGQSIRPFPRRQTPGRDSILVSICLRAGAPSASKNVHLALESGDLTLRDLSADWVASYDGTSWNSRCTFPAPGCPIGCGGDDHCIPPSCLVRWRRCLQPCYVATARCGASAYRIDCRVPSNFWAFLDKRPEALGIDLR